MSINWEKAPKENTKGEITLSGAGEKYDIVVPVKNDLPNVEGFVENNGVVVFEASNFSKKINSKNINWSIIPNLERTNSSLTVAPSNIERQKLNKTSPYVEYEFTVFDEGELTVEAYLSPTQDFRKKMDYGMLFQLMMRSRKR